MNFRESATLMRKKALPKGTPEIGQSVDVMPIDSKAGDYRTSWVAPSKGHGGKFLYTRIK